MNIKQVKKQLLKVPKFREEYNRVNIPFEFSQMIMDFRVKHGLSVKKLAKKLSISERMLYKLENL